VEKSATIATGNDSSLAFSSIYEDFSVTQGALRVRFRALSLPFWGHLACFSRIFVSLRAGFRAQIKAL
jgi:hypothetical protein